MRSSRRAAVDAASQCLYDAIVAAGDANVVSSAVAAGASVNAPFIASGLCPLNTAIVRRHRAAVSVLLSADRIDVHQADSFRVDSRCLQPLHRAAQAGWADVLRALLDRGADADQPDYGEATPLHHAAANGHTGGESQRRCRYHRKCRPSAKYL